MANDGSSPRMRGTLRLSNTRRRLCRFIPAHAGNTPADRCSQRLGSVHPRACGEHGDAAAGLIRDAGSSPRMRGTPCVARFRSWGDHGSSPRMRGTLQQHRGRQLVVRFIPAHAGNTLSQRCRSCLNPVHPRTCGEHEMFWVLSSSSIGSSPHAGNTSRASSACRSGSVHPRACGEHMATIPGLNVVNGSSPRMRGTPSELR